MSKEDWILNKEERRKIRVSLWPETWPVDKEGELALVEQILQGKLHAQNRKTIEEMLEWDNKGCPHWQANHSVFRTPSRCLQCRKELLGEDYPASVHPKGVRPEQPGNLRHGNEALR